VLACENKFVPRKTGTSLANASVIFNNDFIYLSCTVSCQDAFSYVAAGHSSEKSMYYTDHT
jgi:hypothetical protein